MLYSVSQEERSVFREVVLSVILRKKIMWTCVLFRTVSDMWRPVFWIWRAIFSFPSSLWAVTTANWRFTPIHLLQMLANYVGRDGTYCAPNSEYYVPNMGNRSEYDACLFKLFFLAWPILWPRRISTLPSGTPCILAARSRNLIRSGGINSCHFACFFPPIGPSN
jgi:hypothetical protein